MDERARIFVAGHRGLAGGAIVRALEARGHEGLILRTRAELDLRDDRAVGRFFRTERPTHVFDAAARSGGILAHLERPADFLLDNLRIQSNLLEHAQATGVEKLLFLASSAVYPPAAPQPLREDSLLAGPLDPTHEPYALAKLAGIGLCQALRRQHGFNAIVLVPTNLYGPGDRFESEAAPVLPALIRRFDAAAAAGAPAVEVWGSGRARREFLHADDLADAALFLMRRYDGAGIVNVGTGRDVSIAELAALIARVVGFEGEIAFDATRPEGVPRKRLDVSRLERLGWRPRRSLEDGIRETWRWFRRQAGAGRPPPAAAS